MLKLVFQCFRQELIDSLMLWVNFPFGFGTGLEMVFQCNMKSLNTEVEIHLCSLTFQFCEEFYLEKVFEYPHVVL